ncbi:Phosphoglycerate mutase [Caenispirillum salinarum AK4]|uniref:2,3-bisphosphoglycerate-dependent phosphoglycerate mutase n=1 Tax=Caenispirillum salinarum AK4 TaxID=1238182 RepID=K9H9I3_9PROT|nr:2,3-diphosphoglycerate-dependent phosphoglycerate mutase [Caenispirillum salinarum]EKV27273.1 Phosphoglycerate mutase [Caenispirillum salinarum AK4]
MPRLILLRHGESVWNKKNLFTGWTDVDLTEDGRKQGWAAGEALAAEDIRPTVCFTSVLTRAIRTLWLTLDAMNRMWLPVTRDWRLNERHYGALQGLNKDEKAKEVGEEQVHIWRRSYDVPPPELHPDDERAPHHEERYKAVPQNSLPLTECLKDTVDRCMPFWHGPIASALKGGETVLISAHGNSLRGIAMELDSVPPDVIPHVEFPYAVPLVYELDEDLKPVESRYVGGSHKTPAQVKAEA